MTYKKNVFCLPSKSKDCDLKRDWKESGMVSCGAESGKFKT